MGTRIVSPLVASGVSWWVATVPRRNDCRIFMDDRRHRTSCRPFSVYILAVETLSRANIPNLASSEPPQLDAVSAWLEIGGTGGGSVAWALGEHQLQLFEADDRMILRRWVEWFVGWC